MIYVALGLALLLVVGVLVGAKVFFDRAGNQPVSVGALPGPMVESEECRQFIAELPDELLRHDRAEIVEPVPAGVAAWNSSSTEEVTLRCGVDLPFQYTEYSQPVEVDGVEWLQVRDATPDSTLQTWYTVDRSPVVAVTADEPSMGGADNPVEGLSGAVSALPEEDHEPNPAPLSGLASGDTSVCGELMANLPETVAEEYGRVEGTGAYTAAWAAQGLEPVVLRCGVAPPENYEPGAVLHQVNEIPWFEDTTLANGTTSSTWFALGRATDIAVSVPQATGNAAVVELGEAIAAHTPEQG